MMSKFFDSSGFAREYSAVSVRHAEAVDNVIVRLRTLFAGLTFTRTSRDGKIERCMVQDATSEVYHWYNIPEHRVFYLRGVLYKPSGPVGKRRQSIEVKVVGENFDFNEWKLEGAGQ